MIKKLMFFALTVVFFLTGCSEEKKAPLPEGVRGVLVESMQDVGDYYYLEVLENGAKIWIAVVPMNVKKGDSIYFTQFMEMKDFKSEALNKTFESVLFVSDAVTSISNQAQTGGEVTENFQHPQVMKESKEEIKIEKSAGGYTVEEINVKRSELNGKTVKVKGKVVKVNNGIMDKNWIHIQDGTGGTENFDLLVTSTAIVEKGDVIEAEGKVVVDRDFGAGYKYSVLIEDSKVTKAK
ncbi:MAG: DNA-binding protein [Ignavibacteriaceae bacterium]|nr:DNA-binding protein [Ignavibacteriaceae bacterium]